MNAANGVHELPPKPVLQEVPRGTGVQRAQDLRIGSVRGEDDDVRLWELRSNGPDRFDAARRSSATSSSSPGLARLSFLRGTGVVSQKRERFRPLTG